MARGNGRTADYDAVIAELFARVAGKTPAGRSYPFDKPQIEKVILDLKKTGSVKDIKNIPDIKYTYDARKDFPAPIASTGYWAITGRGKAKYCFERIRKNNLIRVPQDTAPLSPKIIHLTDKTPHAVAAVLGADEQATMTRVRYNDILSQFLGFPAYHVQGHERTSLSCGQVEIDEVYVGSSGSTHYVVPISAKGGGKDCLSYTQALNLYLYAAEKSRYHGHTARPLGVLRDTSGVIHVIEFSTSKEIDKISMLRCASYILV
jgi:hypothetical protein